MLATFPAAAPRVPRELMCLAEALRAAGYRPTVFEWYGGASPLWLVGRGGAGGGGDDSLPASGRVSIWPQPLEGRARRLCCRWVPERGLRRSTPFLSFFISFLLCRCVASFDPEPMDNCCPFDDLVDDGGQCAEYVGAGTGRGCKMMLRQRRRALPVYALLAPTSGSVDAPGWGWDP